MRVLSYQDLLMFVSVDLSGRVDLGATGAAAVLRGRAQGGAADGRLRHENRPPPRRPGSSTFVFRMLPQIYSSYTIVFAYQYAW